MGLFDAELALGGRVGVPLSHMCRNREMRCHVGGMRCQAGQGVSPI